MKPNIYDTLQTQILEGRLQPGDRLKEEELAVRFGISRTPVREALRRLETRGLLTHEPYRGVVVARLEPGAVSELYVMREILDRAAAALAARHASETEIIAMERQVARDGKIIAKPNTLAASNRAFHQAVYRAAHNRFLVKSADALSEALALLGPTTLSIKDRGKRSVTEHTAIVAAIKSRDPDAAANAASTHIRAAFEARLQQMDHDIIAESDQNVASGARPKPSTRAAAKPRKSHKSQPA